MAVRIRFIYLLIIVLISFGTIGQGCDPGCHTLDGTSVPCIFESAHCGSGEKKCNDECISDKVVCCVFEPVFLEGFPEIFPCTLSEPICCDAGTCASDPNSCPDVDETFCLSSKPCGPRCIHETETCCNYEEDKGAICQPQAGPICCPEGTSPTCVKSFDECCDGTGCI